MMERAGPAERAESTILARYYTIIAGPARLHSWREFRTCIQYGGIAKISHYIYFIIIYITTRDGEIPKIFKNNQPNTDVLIKKMYNQLDYACNCQAGPAWLRN